MMETEHKGYNIRYTEYQKEGFEIIPLPNGMKDESNFFVKVSDAKKAIDKLAKIKYIPANVWVTGMRDNFKGIRQIEATRPHTRGWREDVEFWVKDDGERMTLSGSSLYLDTPENRKVFPKIVDVQLIIKQSQDKEKELIESLVTLKELTTVK